jgi:hypothetical protein
MTRTITNPAAELLTRALQCPKMGQKMRLVQTDERKTDVARSAAAMITISPCPCTVQSIQGRTEKVKWIGIRKTEWGKCKGCL